MTVRYSDERTEAEIEVRRATVADGARRGRLSAEAVQAAEGEEFEKAFVRIRLHPDLIACSSGRIMVDGVDVFPPDFDAFWNLPEALVVEWQDAVYQVNTHWRPVLQGADAEKKG